MTNAINYIKGKNFFELKGDRTSVIKEWGKEEILRTEGYTVKIMFLKPDFQVSMHLHMKKKETFILIQGELLLETINLENGEKFNTHLKNTLESVTLGENVPHTFYCPEGQIEETIFIEASTEDDVNDNYRFYPSGRKNSHSR